MKYLQNDRRNAGLTPFFLRLLRRTCRLSFLFALILWGLHDVEAQSKKEDYRDQVAELVARPIPDEAKEIRTGIKKIGPPAIPILIGLLDSNTKISPPKKLFLFDLLEDIIDDAQKGLIQQLLNNPSAQIRGRAVIFVGKNKVKSSVPTLVQLLDDNEIYLTRIETDYYQERNILIKHLALEALSNLRKFQMPSGLDENAKIEFWKVWWESERSKRTLKR